MKTEQIINLIIGNRLNFICLDVDFIEENIKEEARETFRNLSTDQSIAIQKELDNYKIGQKFNCDLLQAIIF